MGFFSKAKIKSTEIMEQAVNFLSERYNQAATTFTAASPYGQLLSVIANISELIFSYISHSAEELNIQTARNHESIFGLSRLTGHDPFRGSSAYGNIKLYLNNESSSYLNGGNILIIKNFTKLTIAETGQKYFINTNSDYIKLKLGDNSNNPTVRIMQGEIESQKFTSNGTPLQSFNPIVKSMTDHYNVAVTVNGEEWKRVESLYDMPADDEYGNGKCFMVKSSINVGLTIFFGNGSFGTIPPAGSEIIVTYIKTSGDAGNVYTKNINITFEDYGYDEFGNEVNLDDVLYVEVINAPSLGANYESPDFTKMIAPRISKSFVLANPDNYVTFLSRYNQFSFIYAYNTKDETDEYGNVINNEDDNITYLKIIPNIKKKIGKYKDYFDLPTNEFKLSKDEIDSIASAIEYSGRQLIGTEVQINEIDTQKFVINVIIRCFENSNQSTIRNDIRNILSKYFLNINRNDIIPISDLISLIERINGVDTCDVFFITEKNENAKRYGGYYQKQKVWKKLRWIYEDKWVKTNIEDPRLGFDSFGNIIIDENEFYIAKGGFYDFDGHYYEENITNGKLGPLNIFILDEVEYKAYNQNMQKKLTDLLNNNL